MHCRLHSAFFSWCVCLKNICKLHSSQFRTSFFCLFSWRHIIVVLYVFLDRELVLTLKDPDPSEVEKKLQKGLANAEKARALVIDLLYRLPLENRPASGKLEWMLWACVYVCDKCTWCVCGYWKDSDPSEEKKQLHQFRERSAILNQMCQRVWCVRANAHARCACFYFLMYVQACVCELCCAIYIHMQFKSHISRFSSV